VKSNHEAPHTNLQKISMVQQKTLKKSTAPYGVKRENGAILSEGHTRCLSLCMKNPKRNYPPRMNSFPTFPLDACSCSKENKIPSGKKSSDKKKTRQTAATGRKKGERRNKKHKESRICLIFYLIRLRPPSRLTIPSKEEPTSRKPYSPLPTGTPANGCKIQTQVATAISQAHTNTISILTDLFLPPSLPTSHFLRRSLNLPLCPLCFQDSG